MIFDNLEIDYSLTGMNLALKSILKIKNMKNISGYFSLVELTPDDKDYQWLCNWATGSSYEFVFKSLNQYFIVERNEISWSYKQVFGLMSLLLFSECARRFAREGEIWSHLNNLFPKEVNNLLMNRGQPTQKLKEAIEEGARKVNVYHAFDLIDKQNWYLTIYLQIGFTIRGLESRLPIWLQGSNQSQAVKMLLSDHGSTSFKFLWNKILLPYSSGNLTKEKSISLLMESPWVLPEWIEIILDNAKNRVAIYSPDGKHDSFIPFLNLPKLIVESGNKINFTVQIINLNYFELFESYYDLYISGFALKRLFKKEDGSYTTENFSINLEVTFVKDIMIATIVSPHNEIIEKQELVFFEPDDDITIYDAFTKNRIDSWNSNMVTTKEYYLLISNDLKINSNSVLKLTGFNGLNLYRLSTNWDSNLAILIEDEILWTPQIKENNYRKLALEFSNKVNVIFFNRNFNNGRIIDNLPNNINISEKKEYDIFIGPLPENIEIKYIRFNKIEHEFYMDDLNTNKSLHGAIIQNYKIEANLFKENAKINIGFKNEILALRVSLKPNKQFFSGAMILKNNKWEILAPQSKISVEQAKNLMYKILRPDNHDYYLTEGYMFVAKIKNKISNIGKLVGLGHELRVQKTFYNADEEDILFTISNETANFGLAQTAEYLESKKKFVFEFSNQRELGQEKLLFWMPNNTPEFFNASDYVTIEHTKWNIHLPEKLSDIACLAIILDGYRIASYNTDRLYYYISEMIKSESTQILEIEGFAAMVRWLNLPICNNKLKILFKKAISINPIPFIKQWFTNSPSIYENIFFDENSENWFIAARELFWLWIPETSEQSKKIIYEISSSEDIFSNQTVESLTHIISIDPFLGVKLIFNWMSKDRSKNFQEKYLLIIKIIASISNIYYEEIIDKNKIKVLIYGLLEEVNRSIPEIDNKFIEEMSLVSWDNISVGTYIKALKKRNLRILMNHLPFRKYLAVSLLFNLLLENRLCLN